LEEFHVDPGTNFSQRLECPNPIITIANKDICDIEFCSTELDLTAAVNYPPPPLYDSLEHKREDAIVWFDTPEHEPWFSTPILERPKPIGGMVGIHKRLDYPLTAINNKIEGRVILRAFISEKGGVYKINVIRSLSPECDEAAIKAVKETKFIPTKNKGKAIKSTIAIPIMFKLN
jgi:TonB family protein